MTYEEFLDGLQPWQRHAIAQIVESDDPLTVLMPPQFGVVRFEPYRTKDEHPPEPAPTRTVDLDELDSPFPVVKGDVVSIDGEQFLVVAGQYPNGTLEVTAL